MYEYRVACFLTHSVFAHCRVNTLLATRSLSPWSNVVSPCFLGTESIPQHAANGLRRASGRIAYRVTRTLRVSARRSCAE